jgi:glucosamine-6-phosphate deaminase
MQVTIHDDLAGLARGAADHAAGCIRKAVSDRGVANVMFATGNSQLAFVDALVEDTEDIPWSRVSVLHMDEYVGVGPEHPAGFQRWIREKIAKRVDPIEVHYIDGSSEPEGRCSEYERLLRSMKVDLCCLGIGENGHLAFNDPGAADFEDPRDVKIVELDEKCRRQQVGEGHFPDLDSVPPRAITVTVPALLRARQVLAVVPEARKASAVRAALEGPLDTLCPASVLRTRENVQLHLDRDSASQLRADVAGAEAQG